MREVNLRAVTPDDLGVGTSEELQELIAKSEEAIAARHRAEKELIETLKLERNRASRQARLALSRELSLRAATVLPDDPELSVLLALEAVSATRDVDATVTLEAENVLHRAVQSSFVRLTLSSHTGAIHTIAFNKLGDRVATTSRDGTTDVWDATSGQQLFSIPGRGYQLFDIDFASDGRIAATGWKIGQPEQSAMTIWDPEGNELLSTNRIGTQAAAVVFSPNNTSIAAGTKEGTVLVYSKTGRVKRRFGRHKYVSDLAYLPDGERIISATSDGAVILESKTGKALYVFEPNSNIQNVALSPSGNRLATRPFVGQPKVWDLHTYTELWEVPGEWITDLTFGPDDDTLVTAHGEGTVKVWSIESARHLSTYAGHTNKVNSVTCHSRRQYVATGSDDGTARLWQMTMPHEHDMVILPQQCEAVAFARDWSVFAAAGANHLKGSVEIVDLKSKVRRLMFRTDRDEVNSVAFSPSGNLLAIAARAYPDLGFCGSGSVDVVDLSSGKRLFSSDHGTAIWGVTFSPDGSRLATASWSNSAKVWDANSGEELLTLRGDATVRHVSFAADSRRLVTVGDEHVPRVWDAVTGELLSALQGHTGDVCCAAFSPDGRFLATGGEDRTVRIWDAETGRSLMVLSGHSQPVRGVAYSEDSSRLATVSDDGTARVWNSASGAEQVTLRHGHSKVLYVSFSGDGKYLGIAGAGGTIQIYYLDITDVLRLAAQRVSRILTNEERKKYLHSDV